MARLTEASKYEILYDLPEGTYSQAEVGGISTTTIRAGESLELEVFPIVKIDDGARRERQNRKTSRWQEEVNRNRTRKRVRRICENNFSQEDYFWTGTYDYPRYAPGFANPADILREMQENGCPGDDGDVRRDFKNFLRMLQRRVKQAGHDPKEVRYLYVIESTHEPNEEDMSGLPAHYHIHALIHAPGLNRAGIEACWKKGYSNTKQLDFRSNGIEGLCKYLTKQRRFMRRWACSRNSKQPEEKKSYRKISRRRAAEIAADVQYRGREILEKLYPGYRVEEVTVKYSAFVAGAYIYARMRKLPQKRTIQKRRRI